MKIMDYNQLTFGYGFGFIGDSIGNGMAIDRYANMSDDEKREYIERHRSRLSEHELEKLTASLNHEEDENPDFKDPTSLFRGPSIG